MSTTTFKETAPTGYFNNVFAVMPYAYDFANITNRIKLVSNVQFSKTYTGDWDMILSPVNDDFSKAPTTVHVIWSMIGF